MPAPQASMMQQLARLQFTSFQIKVPQGWQQPSGDPGADHYGKAFKTDEKTTAPGAPPLVQPQSLNKYHTETQKMHIDKFGSYIDKTCSAICSAWSTWQSAATLVGVVVNAVTASMGQVVGPPLTPLILAQGEVSTPMYLKYTNVIANVIGTAWLSYTASIKVPGMPWYPAFAAFPGPVAPPTPNVPCPVIALTQVTASVGKAALKGQMIGQLGDPNAPCHKELFDSIADAFEKVFQIWQGSTLVNNVLGTGPIPTFAPPYVPAGPVVGGVGNMTPGGFT
ncbi:MAG TPA: hypothetical protein VHE35_27590 [Kofleriaceae bacterium]|nr:hypothetical protein [Kofleriaceae bacterium]